MEPRMHDADAMRSEIGYLPTPPCTERRPDRSYPVPAGLRAQLVEHVVVPERGLAVVGQRFAVAALRLGLGDLRDGDRDAYDAIGGLRMFRYAQVVRAGRCQGGISTHAWGTAVDVVAPRDSYGAIADALGRHGFVGDPEDGACDHPHFELSREAITFGRLIDQIRPF